MRHIKLNGILLFVATMAAVQAQPLKTIDLPQGGKIVYGTVTGQTTEAGAMQQILKSIGSQYGSRPEVGKLFAARGTQSVAVFYRVEKANRAGLIIVVKVADDRVEAGVVSDDRGRFGKTFPAMMKTLMASWHPLEGGAAGSSSPAAALKTVVTADRTASVDLPAGWKMDPSSGGGTIGANGPNGEIANFQQTALIADLNNPNARRTYETVSRGGLRGTVYANQVYYPLGPDLTKDYVDLVTLVRQKRGLPPFQIQIRSTGPAQAPAGERCQHISAVVSVSGKGPMEQETIFCVSRPTPAAGVFLMMINLTAAPVALASQERATLGAIMASFRQDSAAVQRQANAYAAPAIEAIHAIGRAAAAQAQAAHQAAAIHNSSVYQRWDSLDRRHQAFSNYLLDYSVVQDNYNNAHGTLWNEDADALVKADPQRFEIVSAPDFWRGIDYRRQR